jgi:hypothetical protein
MLLALMLSAATRYLRHERCRYYAAFAADAAILCRHIDFILHARALSRLIAAAAAA